MKVAIIGSGNVGRIVFSDLQHASMIREITLVGRNREKLRAEVEDAKDAAVLHEGYVPKLTFGGYSATKGADIIIYAAGSAKIKEDRMEMLHDNCVIAEEIFSEVRKYNREAIIICLTNPLDVITMKILDTMEISPRKVIGSGTLLESARVTRIVAELMDISSKSVNTYVVGEHGASAVALFSSARIMGLSLDEYFQGVTDDQFMLDKGRLQQVFKDEPFRIFHGKGYTSTGVSATACRIVSAIASDSREILPVSSVLQGEYGVRDVAVSVPSVVGRNGIEEIYEVGMTDDERRDFLASVEVVRSAAIAEGLLT